MYGPSFSIIYGEAKYESFICMSHIPFSSVCDKKIGHNFLFIKLKLLHPPLTSLAGSPVCLLAKPFQGAPGPFPLIANQLQPARGDRDPERWLILPPEAAVAQVSMWYHLENQDYPGLSLTTCGHCEKENCLLTMESYSDCHFYITHVVKLLLMLNSSVRFLPSILNN